MSVDKSSRLQLKEKYGDEQVFIVPFAVLDGIRNGFTPEKHTKNIWSKFDTVGKYVFRYDAEGEPSMQQIIPYIVVYNPENKKYFLSKRIAGEPRLIGRLSLGFGGHINPCDGTSDVLFNTLFRELHEELIIDTIDAAIFLGYMRDFSSSTNDHTGCVFLVKSYDAIIKEANNLVGEWMTLKELEDNYSKFEGWSKYLIDYLVINKEFK